MSTSGNRRIAAVALAAVAIATLLAPAPRAAAKTDGAALTARFTPDSSFVTLDAKAPPVVHPSGDYFFALVADRLLCTVETATGQYLFSYDLGAAAGFDIARDGFAPISLSSNGKVLAVVGAGTARFFDVGTSGRLTPASEAAVGDGVTVPVALSADGKVAFVASSAPDVAVVRTSDGKRLDALALPAGATPLQVLYAEKQKAAFVVTPLGLAVLKHDDSYKLKQTGAYDRPGFAGGPYAGIAGLGLDGRIAFTIADGGTAVIGVTLKGQQKARSAAPLPDRYSTPVAVSPDAKTVVAATVSGATGRPIALNFFSSTGRNIGKSPKTITLDASLGDLSQVAFDPTGALLAASFPQSGRVLLFDAEARSVVASVDVAGAAEGIAFTPNGRQLLVAGRATSGATAGLGPSVVAVVPVSKRGADVGAAVLFERLPGALFAPGDSGATFKGKSYGIVNSSQADALFSFNVTSGTLLQRLDVGPSMGLLAVAPETRAIVASGGGGLMVLTIDDNGIMRPKAPATPGAVPSATAPSVAFSPAAPVAYVTAGNAVWRVDLSSGGAIEYAVAPVGSSLTNPVVSRNGDRLSMIQDGTRLVRCALDGFGGVSLIDTVQLEATLDPAAPRVAYDATGEHMWVADRTAIREYNVISGVQGTSSDAQAVGRDTVLVAPDLLAALPEGDAPLALFSLESGTPRLVKTVDLGSGAFAPYVGGGVAVDAATRTLFVPLTGQRKVVAVHADGTTETLDSSSAALQLSFLPAPSQLIYPDVTAFPGSTVVATGF